MLSSCREKKRPPDNTLYVKTCNKNPKKTKWWYHGKRFGISIEMTQNSWWSSFQTIPYNYWMQRKLHQNSIRKFHIRPAIFMCRFRWMRFKITDFIIKISIAFWIFNCLFQVSYFLFLLSQKYIVNEKKKKYIETMLSLHVKIALELEVVNKIK